MYLGSKFDTLSSKILFWKSHHFIFDVCLIPIFFLIVFNKVLLKFQMSPTKQSSFVYYWDRQLKDELYVQAVCLLMAGKVSKRPQGKIKFRVTEVVSLIPVTLFLEILLPMLNIYKSKFYFIHRGSMPLCTPGIN